MRYNSGLIASMEEIDNEPITDKVEAAEVATTVADDSAEIQTDGDEIGTSVAEVEDAVQGGEELEAIGGVAADAVESGEGLSEDAAEVASIAIESIRNRLGFRATTRLVPATESFGNTNTRLMSTRLVVEGVMDSIKKIWAAIKSAMARVWEKIKSFLAKLFNSAGMLGKHINSLRERARSLPTNAKPKEKTIKTRIATEIADGDKANLASYEQISKNTLILVEAAKKMGEAQKKVSAAAANLASGEINKESVQRFLSAQKPTVSSAIENALRSLNVGHREDVAKLVSTKGPKDEVGSKTTTVSYGPFVGNTLLVVGVTPVSVYGLTHDRVHMSFQSPDGKAPESVDALTPGEIVTVLDQANKTVQSLQDMKKVQAEYDDITKSVTRVADSVLKNTGKILEKTGSSDEVNQGLKELKSEVQSVIASMSSFGSKAPSLMFQLAKAGADYASICMRNLETDNK